MPKTPRETIQIRRLPAKGDRLKLTVEVVRVAEAVGAHEGMVTLRIPGALAPVTIPANYLPKDD